MLTSFSLVEGTALVRFAARPVCKINKVFRNLITQETNGTVGPNKTFQTLCGHLSSATSSGHFGHHQVDFIATYTEKNTEMEVTVHTLRYVSLDYYSL
jgi:hypothetical protein